jgi:hypothetical protein
MTREKLLVASILVIMLLPGCILNSGGGAVSVKVLSVGEKDMVCSFGERVTLNVTAKSSVSLDNVTVKITGLKNKLNQMKLSKSQFVELSRGINVISFAYRTPACSPCNRLDPGVYSINATISYDGELLAYGSGNIELKL